MTTNSLTQSLAAVWVPGLPHILRPDKSAHWARCALAMEAVGQRVQEEKFERIVVFSTQWLSVLGTSFQAHPHPRGIHVDDNWYELGDLPFNFSCDGDLVKGFSGRLESQGLPAKTVNFEGFPVDTGTIVALRFLNPQGLIPVSVVSSWVYATADTAFRLGETMKQVASEAKHKTLFVAVSALSARFATHEIDPERDAIDPSFSDNRWNQQVLSQWERGDLGATKMIADQYAKEAKADMGFHAFHWLHGVVGQKQVHGRISHYGPIWGTGAAVVEFYAD